jgi:hypothetical protein
MDMVDMEHSLRREGKNLLTGKRMVLDNKGQPVSQKSAIETALKIFTTLKETAPGVSGPKRGAFDRKQTALLEHDAEDDPQPEERKVDDEADPLNAAFADIEGLGDNGPQVPQAP